MSTGVVATSLAQTLNRMSPHPGTELPGVGQAGLASPSEWEKGRGGAAKTLRYMNCEIKWKYSNKERQSNISKDVYQALKLNTDFFINPKHKRQ